MPTFAQWKILDCMEPCLLTPYLRSWLARAAVLFCLAGLWSGHSAVHAASLGRLAVHSGPGQPLKADIEILSPPPADKMSTLLVELASREDFQYAGIEYSPELRSLQLSLINHDSGLLAVRLITAKPISTPVLSFLLVLRWSGGRQVREFTLNLEEGSKPGREQQPPALSSVPPSLLSSAPPRPLSGAVNEAVEVLPVPPAGPAPGSPATVVQKSPGKRAVPEVSMPPVAAASPSSGRRVRPGETLYRIALENKPPEISVEQMLWGLFQRNPEAFLGGNLNRLQAGAVLQMPDRESLAPAGAGAAKKIVAEHHQAWLDYRQTLAASAPIARIADGARGVSGKISARVEDKTAAADLPRDRLMITPARQAAAAQPLPEEELVAHGKAAQDAAERIAALEKNIVLLQKLLEARQAAQVNAPAAAPAKAGGLPAVEKLPEPAPEDFPPYLWGVALAGALVAVAYAVIRRQRRQRMERVETLEIQRPNPSPL